MPAKPPPKMQYSRAEMIEILKRNESVMWRGDIITRVEDLPSDADLAGGDPAARQAALAAVDSQIRSLSEQRAQLTRPTPAPAEIARGNTSPAPAQAPARPEPARAEPAKPADAEKPKLKP